MDKTKYPTHKYFQREDVNVRYAGHTHFEARREEKFPSRESMLAVEGGFKPGRLVINLKLVDLNDPNNAMLHFDPPIELRIRYDTNDLASAKLSIASRHRLTFGFWDGKQWIPFTGKEHGLDTSHWDKTKGRGLAVMYIHDWGDPPIAVGT